MFWDNFKDICDKKRLKPTPVLKEAGISTGSIGRWQAGSSPNADAVIALADYLQCSTDLLLRGCEYDNGSNTVSVDELDFLNMVRTLPEASREFIYDSVKTAYEKELARRETEKRLLG